MTAGRAAYLSQTFQWLGLRRPLREPCLASRLSDSPNAAIIPSVGVCKGWTGPSDVFRQWTTPSSVYFGRRDACSIGICSLMQEAFSISLRSLSFLRGTATALHLRPVQWCSIICCGTLGGDWTPLPRPLFSVPALTGTQRSDRFSLSLEPLLGLNLCRR